MVHIFITAGGFGREKYETRIRVRPENATTADEISLYFLRIIGIYYYISK